MTYSPDSTKAGYLAPVGDLPIQGQELNRFIQQFIAGITGMDGKYVRPAWQGEPPVIPAAAQVWAAVATTTVPANTFPTVLHVGSAAEGQGEDELQQQEQINVLTSFYDLGTNGLADGYGGKLRNGLSIAQNLEPLELAGMGLTSYGALLTVPSLLKERWLYRVDFDFIIGRQVSVRYPVRNVLSLDVEVVTDPTDMVNPIQTNP